MKYILYWVLIQVQPTSCPEGPKPDEFGKMPTIYSSCAVAHFEQKRIKMSKKYNNELELNDAYARALKREKEIGDLDSVRMEIK